MKQYHIQTVVEEYSFVGEYLREREKPNWHYYQTDDGRILHFRKEHMVCVIEAELSPFYKKEEK